MSTTFYALLESTLNGYCQLDPDYRNNLEKFAHKVIQIKVKEPEIEFYLLSNPQGFQVHQYYEGKVDATISASLVNYIFLALADKNEQQEQVLSKQVSISGNIKLAQSLQHYFSALEIDWEEHLSHLTGDFVAYGLSSLTSILLQKRQKFHDDIIEKIMHELINETQDLVTKNEINTFVSSVDNCRNEVDRLEARLKKIEQRAHE